MAIKIQTQETSIPVEFGNLNFAFDVSDASIEKFRTNALQVKEELEKISVENLPENELISRAKDVLRKGYDMTLGEGAFEKIYEQTPSILVLMGCFTDLYDSLDPEINRIMGTSTQQKAEKYLAEKAKQNKQ